MRKLVAKLAVAVALAAAAGTAAAGNASFKDPTGDDKGPGKYVYPTDTVYKPGSFDLTSLDVKDQGGKVQFDVGVNSGLEDPWGMKTGFAVQMIFVFIKTGEGGHTEGLPGLNVEFAPDAAWNKVVILSPQGSGRVKAEVGNKAGALAKDVIVPNKVSGSGRKITATIDKAALGGGDPATWSYQVVVQSNEGFPAGSDLLTRKVNEFEGQHRFGGGDDSDCDPHVMDLLAGAGAGAPGEAQEQFQMLAYDCAAGKKAQLGMVKKQ